MADSKKGTLNTLLNYRFMKKAGNKLNHSDSSEHNGLSRESSGGSDSQNTIPYNSQNSFGSASDSQATIPYDSQATVSPSQVCEQNHVKSPSANNTSTSPASKGTASSPVFKSNGNVNSDHIIKNSLPSGHIPIHDQNQNCSAETPWISKATGGPVHVVQSKENFKRIKRPSPDSDSDGEDFGNGSGIKVDREKLKRLKELFPNEDVRRMKAALFAYNRDFQKAIAFMASPEENSSKRRHATTVDNSDELPAITGSRKRIKMMPQTPSPTKESGFSLTPSKQVNQDAIGFLRECFPQKSTEHIEKILQANDGDTERASVALASEGGEDSKVAESLASEEAGTSGSKLLKVVKEQKAKASNGNAKHKDNDLSEDDEDEYGDDYESADSESSEDFDNRTKSEIDNYLQFFEEATVDEVAAMPGCSKKKAELIVTLRPFKSWDDLCLKFDNTKPLSISLISGCKEIMRVRNAIRRLMVRCESISQQMEKVICTLTGQSQRTEELNDDGKIVKQPDLLNKEHSLKPYQLIGLSWLRIMHEQELNGILADEMGLGKTIQAISFLAHLLEQGEEGPHVIIVPSSTIESWLRELQLWCPALKIIVYYGSQDERRAVRHSIFVDDEHFHVLLTTYNMATGGTGDRVLFKKYDFHYAIFDEGHMLKNMSSLRFQNLMKIAAERRLLLTGTPLQNNLLELMSLLCFVMPEIFQGKTDHLKKMFAMISRTEDKQKSRFEWDKIAQAKRIMKPFILRRLKKDVLNQLPAKIEKILKCPMADEQKNLYDGLVTHYAQVVEKGEESTPGGGIGVFMQFRKAANHPLLLRHIFTDDVVKKMAKKIATEPSHRERGALPKLIEEDMAIMNDFELIGLCRQYKKYLGKFEPDPSIMTVSGKFQRLDELLPSMKEKGDRILLFSQFTMMLDVVERYLEQRQHKFIRMDGQTPVTDRLQLIDRFNNEPDIFIFLLSTRAGGLGINLTAANTIILHDIDFNPYNDKQAEDRCHRLGQTREVTVIRLISDDTVDEAMLRCANDKLTLEKDLHGSGVEEENEESTKDVASLLKEILQQHQKKHVRTGPMDCGGDEVDGDIIEIGDEDDSSQSIPDDDANKNGGDDMIEIGDDDEDS